jgi:hypothetical protein
MSPLPFIVVLWAVAILVICRWFAGVKREDEIYTDKMQ